MKSFTDVNQSKKLAEILPIESADMHFVTIDMGTCEMSVGLGNYIGVLPSVPCWSLSALMSQMPCAILQVSDDGHYRVFMPDIYSEWHESAVDACVELLERARKEEEK